MAVISITIFCLWLIVSASSVEKQSISGTTEWLSSSSKIEFNSKEVPHTGLLNRLYWVEKNERSTSRNYTFWEEADVYLLEWPGNITRFHQNNPLVKWGHQRAKYLEDNCGEEFTGIEMRVYAYNYVYLTWGPYRLTRRTTEPLTVPRSLLHFNTLAKLSRKHSYEENVLNTVVVYDLAFTFDTLLLAYMDGIIQISGLEMSWAEISETPKRPLKYSLSKGINGHVDKIVVQSCCLKTEFCAFGNMVVAYNENSRTNNRIYTSYDGGKTFKEIQSQLQYLGILKLVLSFPEFGQLLVFREIQQRITMTEMGLSVDGRLNKEEIKELSIPITGNFRGSRLGMESSFIVWDNCSVWYSPDQGSNISRSVLYIHKKLRKNNGNGMHSIVSKSCNFGVNSDIAYGRFGKFILMDGSNNVFLGIDSKTNLSQLVALKMDMSLLVPGTELSVAPFIEYISDQPKLMYPPRYLELPKALKLDRSYERRLGMRILPKNVYPSDFILSFYQENVLDTKIRKKFSLMPCQTSSLHLNYSITQKRKLYHISPSTILNFTVTFTSRLKRTRQLQFEPAKVLKYLDIQVIPKTIDVTEYQNLRYFMKYTVVIIPKLYQWNIGKTLKINFYTKQDLRCNHQPRVPVFIKFEDKLQDAPQSLTDEDMAQSTYLKSVIKNEVNYLENFDSTKEFKMETCSK